MRCTKIICTIGPSSREPEMLRRLQQAGMNIARLNFSHGDHNTHGEVVRRIRDLNQTLKYPVAVMLDTQGPEIRTGFNEVNLVVVSPQDESDSGLKLNGTLISDTDRKWAGWFGMAHGDDSHGTLLLDASGREVWRNAGHEPYMDAEALIRRAKKLLPATRMSQGARQPKLALGR